MALTQIKPNAVDSTQDFVFDSITIDGIVLSNSGGSLTITGAESINVSTGFDSSTQSNAAYDAANSASNYANSAFDKANNSLSTTSGGTVTGSVTLRATNALRVESASTEDAVVISPRAGGTSSFSANLTTSTLTATRTVTIPDENLTIGFRNIPPVGIKTSSYTLSTTDVGKYVQVGNGGSIIIPDSTFAEGDAINVFNNTSGSISITCSITTAYIAGTDVDVSSITLATRGMATILFISSTVCVIVGNVT
jgi:hypothetical protein